jgi:calreticulin
LHHRTHPGQAIPQGLFDCGEPYIKLLPGNNFDAANFGGDTPYSVMFGPDICSYSNKRTHVILHSDKKNNNLLIKKDSPSKIDNLTYLYTLIIRTDNNGEWEPPMIDNPDYKGP